MSATGGEVLAQSAEDPARSRNLDIDTFRPAPRTGPALIALERPEVAPLGAWGMGLFFHHAIDPLVVEATDQSGEVDEPVAHRSVTRLAGAVSLGVLELGASIPYLQQSGNEPSFSGIEPASGTALGNLTLRGKASVVEVEPLALGLSAELALPTSDRGMFAGAGAASFHGAALAALSQGRTQVVVNAGARFRETRALADVEQGNELTYGLGGAYELTETLAATAELRGALGLDAQSSQGVSPLELTGGIRYWPERRIGVVAGAGRGILPGIGSPSFRGFLLLSMAPGRQGGNADAPAAEAGIPEAASPPADPAEEAQAPPEESGEFACAEGDGPKQGCPEGEDALVMLLAERIETFESVHFRERSAEILPRSYNLLAHVAAALRKDESIERVSIEAHVQPSGDAAADRALSKKRAKAVRAWLAARGVDKERLAARGRGGEKPLVDPGEEGARNVNERIEFVLAASD